MIYFLIYLSSFLLVVLNVSVLPHLGYYVATGIYALPFVAIISIKDKSISPLLLAFMTGIVYDALGGTVFPVYTITFLAVAISAKLLLNNLTSYGVYKASFGLVGVGLLFTIILSYPSVVSSLRNPNLLVYILSMFLSTFIFAGVLYLSASKFFDYIEKYSSERFR